MRLTNYLRQAYINAIMQDVPCENEDDNIRTMVVKAAVAALPDEGQLLYENAPQHLTKSYLYINDMSITVPGNWPLNSCTGKLVDCYGCPMAFSKEDRAAIAKLVDKNHKAKKTVQELRSKLEGVANGATTVKQLAELLPEFAKYLPKQAAPARNLPVVTNVVSEFYAAGWPKQSTNGQNRPST